MWYCIKFRAQDERESDAKKSKLHSPVKDVLHEAVHDGSEKQCKDVKVVSPAEKRHPYREYVNSPDGISPPPLASPQKELSPM